MAVLRPHAPRKQTHRRPRFMYLSLFLVAFHIFWFLSSSFFLLSIFRSCSPQQEPASSSVVVQPHSLLSVASIKWRRGDDGISDRSLEKEKPIHFQAPFTTTFLNSSILHSRRAAFLANTSLILTLNANESCRGKEELLAILYAAALKPSKKMRKHGSGNRVPNSSFKGRRFPRPSYTTRQRERMAELNEAAPGGQSQHILLFQKSPANKTIVDERLQTFKELREAEALNATNDTEKALRPPPRPFKKPLPFKKPEWWQTFQGTPSELLATCPTLPTWQQVTSLYGPEPVVLGMETCAAYRQRVAAAYVQPKVRIAGLFNSGTTSLSQAMRLNFPGTDVNKGVAFKGNLVEYDVPWGKHVPPKYRENKHPIQNKESPKYVFPVIIVRHPYRWMYSMCKEGYDASWDREAGHCPNIVRATDAVGASVTNTANPVRVSYQQTRNQINETHASLSDYWSDWIRNYYDLDEPRLLVRHEDLLFHAEELMLKITECVGLDYKLSLPYYYNKGPSKKHGSSADFLSALANYGREIVVNMTRDDLDYVQSWTPSSRKGLDAELMAKFHYNHPIGTAPQHAFG